MDSGNPHASPPLSHLVKRRSVSSDLLAGLIAYLLMLSDCRHSGRCRVGRVLSGPVCVHRRDEQVCLRPHVGPPESQPIHDHHHLSQCASARSAPCAQRCARRVDPCTLGHSASKSARSGTQDPLFSLEHRSEERCSSPLRTIAFINPSAFFSSIPLFDHAPCSSCISGCICHGDVYRMRLPPDLDSHVSDIVGWKNTTVYPVIIGNAGTITNTAHNACEALGSQAAARITLLRALSIDSVRRTAAIWQPRLAKSVGQQPEPVDVPVPEPQQPAPEQDPQPPGQPAEPAPSTGEPGPSTAAPSRTQSDAGKRDVTHKNTMDITAPVIPNAWQTVTDKRRRPRQRPCRPDVIPEQAAPEQTRPAKRSRNSFAVLAHLFTGNDPSIRVVTGADTTETPVTARRLRATDGHSPVRPHSMTLRPKRANGADAGAHPTHSTKRKTGHTACQRTSSRQQAIKQQAAR